jgi:3-phenylpropionate/trans-cinnamate dioxygenase ferredoxin component
MSDWITVAAVSDFPPGTWKTVEIDDASIAVFNIEGHYYAIANVCTHDGGSLSGGRLEGDNIICPRHGARFCVRTGEVKSPPAYEDVSTFPVRVEKDEVQICSV